MEAQKGASFGQRVRELRRASNVSLRKFAERVGISATYLSKIEREELPPPAEERVKTIANLLRQDPDELLALAGRVSSDLPAIIRERPREMAVFLRLAKRLSAEELAEITRTIHSKL